ncbi:outer membrane beta-barrel protein [Aliikangiella coralliicola]|uniref:Porin family protein n=1 Tax=Aliikangiella coralliicola TaxID=2592383 RepID=A0A545U4J2_9GAMM|nr:outer membrane beta-barrel protein [Aliikangiella coralliicola]TQV84391.1 porin family protein [Aliikangiella coralliicola]
MKKTVFNANLIALCLLTIIPTESFADDEQSKANRHSLTFSLGNSDHALNDNSVLHATNTSSSYAINYDYQMTDSFALSLGHIDLGDARVNTDVFNANISNAFIANTETNGYTFAGILNSDIGDGPWSGFIRLGMIDWRSEATLNSLQMKTVEKGTDVFAGVGLTYHFNNNVNLSLTADKYNIKFNEDNAVTVIDGNLVRDFGYDNGFTVYSIALSYSF